MNKTIQQQFNKKVKINLKKNIKNKLINNGIKKSEN